MTDLLTITLNPALDISAGSDSVVPGPKLRLDAPIIEAGGGGINVARAAATLGGQVRALVALGGPTGQRIEGLLRDAGIDLRVFALSGDTRQSLAVTDRRDGQQYRFQFPGPQWDDDAVGALLAVIAQEAAGRVVVLSGSQPPGVPDDMAQRVARVLTADARLVVDTSGAALRHLATRPDPGAMPAVLRMDDVEAESLAGSSLPDVAASAAFAQALVAAGVAGCVVLARGAEGSVLAAPDIRLHCRPPLVAVVSKIGAGDSFTAAFALAMARAQGWEAALVAGTAAAAAAVMTPGSALCRAEDVARLTPNCALTPV